MENKFYSQYQKKEFPKLKNYAEWKKRIAKYCKPDPLKSSFQLLLTVFLFASTYVLMAYSLKYSYWVTLLLSIPAALFLLRLFMIQHDCGHRSYFKSKKLQDFIGFFIGVFTITPYHYWKKTHAYHHSHSGDLDFRGFGDLNTCTVDEYMALPKKKRFFYRFYRHPVILLGLGPIFHFIIKHRYPWDIPKSWKKEWKWVWFTNVAMLLIYSLIALALGFKNFLLVQAPITFLACSMGVFLFYVQHQFENTYWYRHHEWNYYESAIFGSTHLVLPKFLSWLTADIGIHHVHHLNSMIPNYNLKKCLVLNDEFKLATKINLKDCFKLLRYSLWCEEKQKLILFKDLKARTA